MEVILSRSSVKKLSSTTLLTDSDKYNQGMKLVNGIHTKRLKAKKKKQRTKKLLKKCREITKRWWHIWNVVLSKLERIS